MVQWGDKSIQVQECHCYIVSQFSFGTLTCVELFLGIQQEFHGVEQAANWRKAPRKRDNIFSKGQTNAFSFTNLHLLGRGSPNLSGISILLWTKELQYLHSCRSIATESWFAQRKHDQTYVWPLVMRFGAPCATRLVLVIAKRSACPCKSAAAMPPSQETQAWD